MSKTILAICFAILLMFTFNLLKSNIKNTDSLTSQQSIRRIFDQWARSQNKMFRSEIEAEYRFAVFRENYLMIENHNSQANKTYTMALNQFADLTKDEFKQYYLGLTVDQEKIKSNYKYVPAANTTGINWNTTGFVGPVLNQGQCGSCWAFSAAQNLNAITNIKNQSNATRNYAEYSEQQLVDCSGAYGNYGCNGGLMDYAFDYVIAVGGIQSAQSYPYTAMDGNCVANETLFTKNIITKYTNVPSGNCSALATALQGQPISIGVDAQNWSFYSGGVFSNCQDQLDHGVLLVGIDQNQNWIVKNSWGPSWGQNGYIYLRSGNTCGICNTASYGNI